jgi:Fe2+ or Zn2+ uptake regulation protein
VQARVVSRAFGYDREFHAEELVQALASEALRVSRVTVFRTLQRLVSVGMLSKDEFVFRRLTTDN